MANKIFAEEVELPVITICHLNESLRADKFKYGLDRDNLKAGMFYPEHGYNGHNVSTEEMFEHSLNEHYYLLDVTGRLSG